METIIRWAFGNTTWAPTMQIHHDICLWGAQRFLRMFPMGSWYILRFWSWVFLQRDYILILSWNQITPKERMRYFELQGKCQSYRITLWTVWNPLCHWIKFPNGICIQIFLTHISCISMLIEWNHQGWSLIVKWIFKFIIWFIHIFVYKIFIEPMLYSNCVPGKFRGDRADSEEIWITVLIFQWVTLWSWKN